MNKEDEQRKADEQITYEILGRISALEEQVDFLNESAIANLRDFFATSALAMLSNPGFNYNDVNLAALRAYEIADAMIAQRDKESK